MFKINLERLGKSHPDHIKSTKSCAMWFFLVDYGSTWSFWGQSLELSAEWCQIIWLSLVTYRTTLICHSMLYPLNTYLSLHKGWDYSL